LVVQRKANYLAIPIQQINPYRRLFGAGT
jgi:hypothetical protein